MNTFILENKACLITGGLGGYGLAITELLLKRGAKVMLGDLKPQKEGEEILSQQYKDAYDAKLVKYTECDVTKEESFEAAIIKTNEDLADPDKTLDILINGAGIVGEQRWEKLYDININGVHRGILLAFKHMKNGGVVMNVSSTAGITCTGDMMATPAYVASKHAITALTRTFGHDLYYKRHGVRVVAVAPYFIETPLNKDNFADWTEDEEAINIIRQNSVGKPFLTTGEAALKLVNVLNAKNGSVWMIRPEQMQPFNVPDYVLPKPRNAGLGPPKPMSFCYP